MQHPYKAVSLQPAPEPSGSGKAALRATASERVRSIVFELERRRKEEYAKGAPETRGQFQFPDEHRIYLFIFIPNPDSSAFAAGQVRRQVRPEGA
jgi:hypothetical protein